MKKIATLASLALLATPALAFAAFGGIQGYIDDIRGLVDTATLLVAAIALLVFFWGLVQFIIKAGDPKANAEGKNLMLWGVIAFFVMVSVWGLVRFIQGELGITDNTAVDIPVF